MDGVYLPNGRQLALIDREWILDELPHLGNPDDNSDANYLLASAAAANCSTSAATGSSLGRTISTIGTGSSSSHGTTRTASATSRTIDSTGTVGSTGVNHHATEINHNSSVSYNLDEFESDLTLLSEIVDETQNKWSDFGLNQLLTSYARSNQPTFK
ncbi:unnamed protein product [Rotaria magnacalcarata]|uniref:Uncharacterized protein n=2 Tax=Rotaria magnacalcarata TaxID=392030 RepID=A0A816Q4X5_9BILA|nr:unnamed protein product [Rotaria magnacalcarata]CAF1682917.1 unnamed protein product [Rotaria magnacalcarata]CAF2057154.1 unnamed protein product [Rotaria magnacalcarata]CAF2125687.1 unnamed protein product [Rotaria magnacalcarata]CAF3902164.1 unnamed protein product [Rotaria magnacalcarata]